MGRRKINATGSKASKPRNLRSSDHNSKSQNNDVEQREILLCNHDTDLHDNEDEPKQKKSKGSKSTKSKAKRADRKQARRNARYGPGE